MATAGTSSSLLKQEEVFLLLDQLPKELFWYSRVLCKWGNYWFISDTIKGILAFQSHFIPQFDDVILASSMKTGTTWLKALCLCIKDSQTKLPAADLDHDGSSDLLVKNVSHAHVRTLEYDLYIENPEPDLSFMTSPRLFHTHLPYSALPDSIKNSKECKMVYITRNPKDTLVSLWQFYNKIDRQNNQDPYPFEKAYDAFCQGIHPYGPFHDHALEYWLESLKMPERILFLKYLELRKDPRGEVKKLASFLGRPFVNEDEVDKVLWRSSLDRLKNLDVNKHGVYSHNEIPNSSFFRLGVVGDWIKYFTPEMKQGLDEITRIKLEGSGLYFDTS